MTDYLYYENILQNPTIVEKIKKSPRIFRHFNYSRLEDKAYHCQFIGRNDTPAMTSKIAYVKTMYGHAHGVQIGHLRVFFSGQMPIGIFHPDIGSVCVDNLWDRRTAYHLNRINRNTDERVSLEVFHSLLNEFLRKELQKNIHLYIPTLDDYNLRNKLIYGKEGKEYLSEIVW